MLIVVRKENLFDVVSFAQVEWHWIATIHWEGDMWHEHCKKEVLSHANIDDKVIPIEEKSKHKIPIVERKETDVF